MGDDEQCNRVRIYLNLKYFISRDSVGKVFVVFHTWKSSKWKKKFCYRMRLFSIPLLAGGSEWSENKSKDLFFTGILCELYCIRGKSVDLSCYFKPLPILFSKNWSQRSQFNKISSHKSFYWVVQILRKAEF